LVQAHLQTLLVDR
jgi:hypothetical protein